MIRRVYWQLMARYWQTRAVVLGKRSDKCLIRAEEFFQRMERER